METPQPRALPMIQRWWRTARRYVYLHVIHADDTPHRVARGVGIGLFVALLPILGLQMAIAFALAALTRGNRILAMAMTWLSNPFTSLPIFWGLWRTGHGVLRMTGSAEAQNMLARFEGMIRGISHASWSDLWTWAFWRDSFWLSGSLGMEIWIEMWVGALMVGALLFIPTYYLTLWVVTHVRSRRAHRKAHRRRLALLRKAAAAAKCTVQTAGAKPMASQA